MTSNRNILILLVNRTVNDPLMKDFDILLSNSCEIDRAQKFQIFDRLRQKKYDLVFLDEFILTGNYSLIQQIMDVQPSTRVIVVTDTTEWRRVRQAFQNGAQDYVATSIQPDELTKIIQEAMMRGEK